MQEFSYIVPESTSSENIVKTFTFPTPVMSGTMCVDWAFISHCPGSRLIAFSSTIPTTWYGLYTRELGSLSGQYYQQGRDAHIWSDMDGYFDWQAIREITLNAWDSETEALKCAGSTVEMKVCITLSDFHPSSSPWTGECVCDETCTGNASYVGVTGVTP